MRNAEVILIVDLDNTLYDFAAFFSPSFRAMIHALAPRLELSEQDLISQFKYVYEKHNTIEYPFVVQELPSIQNKTPTEVSEFVHVANVSYSRTRRRHLKLYPHVYETLKWASDGGVKVCVATNAPIYQAYRRLRDLGLLRLLALVTSRDGIHIPEELPDYERKYRTAIDKLSKTMDRVAVHSLDNLKPHNTMLELIHDHYGGHDPAYFSVGDSIAKDLYPSHLLGMTTVWARYGTKIAVGDLETMLSVTPSATLRSLSSIDGDAYKPDFTVDDFGALRDILPIPNQLSLI
jgi:phosphoglycolate phosphatase